jgi:HAD superfamily hydrolase (TIGR01450 family)
MFDLDGTLIRGDRALPGAIDLVTQLRRAGTPIVFCTQDAEHANTAIADRLGHMGFQIEPNDIVSTGAVVAEHMATHYPGTTIQLIGTARQRNLLLSRGIQLSNDDGPARVLLLGLYPGFSARDFNVACRAVWDGAEFLAIANDRSLPTGDGLLPCTGAFVKAVEHATRRRARILGKPSAHVARAALRRLGQPSEAVLMVGDNIDIDIRMGKSVGCRTALVLSGSTSTEDIARVPARLRPDIVIDDVRMLPERLWP